MSFHPFERGLPVIRLDYRVAVFLEDSLGFLRGILSHCAVSIEIQIRSHAPRLWCFHEGLTMVVVLAAIALRHEHFDFLANPSVGLQIYVGTCLPVKGVQCRDNDELFTYGGAAVARRCDVAHRAGIHASLHGQNRGW
jgi:hypothetical protein